MTDRTITRDHDGRHRAHDGMPRVFYQYRAEGSRIVGYYTDRYRIDLGGAHVAQVTTAAEVKKHVRRLRDQEAPALDALDAEITEAEQHLRALRAQREEWLRHAWQKGNVVRLAEVAAEAQRRAAAS